MNQDGRERIVVKKTFGGEEFDVIYMKGTPGKTKEEMAAMRASGNVNADPAAAMFSYCAPLNQRTYEAAPGVVCHQDVAVKMRDGVTLYADIYLPKDTEEKVPCIVSWGIFGKRPAEGQDDWKLMGVPPKTVSEMAKFESADPGYWCHQGYAVANVDARGVGNSEGYCNLWGTEDAQDGYDFIEWAAQQDWCNGKCTLFGNSGVCMANWKIAQLQPPHLACLAAWEGTSDLYRESYFCGGVPNPAYEANIVKEVACKTYIEDTVAMVEKYPLWNAYWADKQVDFKSVKCPTYVTAGWVHHHLRGATEGFRRIRAPKKWLRIHRDFEWPDSYNPDNLVELKRFFDRYCKDVNNGWEFTPKVRIDVLDAFDYDYAVKRTEKEWPLARTEYKKLYLNAADMDGAVEKPYANESKVSYNPDTDTTEFLIPVNEDVEITGYMKLHLWIASSTYTNADIFPWVLKYNANKEYVPIEVMGAPYRGAWGFCRATHRDLSPLAKDFQPIQAHKEYSPLTPGEPICVDIEMYPHSRIWHKGEYIVVRLAGKFWKTEWFHDSSMNHSVDNGGAEHIIYTGGKYDSYLQIPTVPPKYKSGDYVYRG